MIKLTIEATTAELKWITLPMSLLLMPLIMKIMFKLIFSNETLISYKTRVTRSTRASASAIMCELGKKSKNYYRMRDLSFWELYNELKDEINKAKKMKNERHMPNALMYSSLRIRISLRVLAVGSPLDVAAVCGVGCSKALFSACKLVDAVHNTNILNTEFPECHTK